MESRAFLLEIPRRLRPLLASGMRNFKSSNGFGLVKFHYGNAKLHYEANHQARSHTIEIGLHFEADRFTNARLLGAFRVHEKRIRRELPAARLEEWDKGWTRIWEPVEYERLDAALQRHVAERLAAYITVLEPILREELPADVPWEVATPRRSPAPRKRSR